MGGKFGRALRIEMDAKGLSTKELGKISGVNYRTIEGWLSERGITPRLDDALDVAQALKVPVEHLMRVPVLNDISTAKYTTIGLKIADRFNRLLRAMDGIADIETFLIVQDLIQSLAALLEKVERERSHANHSRHPKEDGDAGQDSSSPLPDSD
jgi:transcriptional regulator with XRE-family HTH domain